MPILIFSIVLMIAGLLMANPGAVKDAHRALVDWCIKEWPTGIYIYGSICFLVVFLVSFIYGVVA